MNVPGTVGVLVMGRILVGDVTFEVVTIQEAAPMGLRTLSAGMNEEVPLDATVAILLVALRMGVAKEAPRGTEMLATAVAPLGTWYPVEVPEEMIRLLIGSTAIVAPPEFMDGGTSDF